MNRLQKRFSELKQKNEKAAVFFITAGDPSIEETLRIMTALSNNHADVIELGMPFSDPMADGPVIQQSTARALQHNLHLDDIFKTVKLFRAQHETPVVLMGYFNPILRYGPEAFVRDAAAYGVDGFIIADVPFEEGEEFEQTCRQHSMSLVYLLAPDIDPQRTASILDASDGFVYVVAQYSTTGASSNGSVRPETIASLRKMTELPVCVGFGISSPEKARAYSEHADGVIIGSWLIREMQKSENKAETAGQIAQQVKQAVQEK